MPSPGTGRGFEQEARREKRTFARRPEWDEKRGHPQQHALQIKGAASIEV